MTARLGLAALLVALAAPAAAHEVLHEVARGKAIALRAHHADGEPLAYAAYELYAPSDPELPFQKGRTDRAGWLAFVPDAPGPWRVKVITADGHGLDVVIEAAPGEATAAAPPPRAPHLHVLRPALGAAAIAALFGALHLLRRRKGARP